MRGSMRLTWLAVLALATAACQPIAGSTPQPTVPPASPTPPVIPTATATPTEPPATETPSEAPMPTIYTVPDLLTLAPADASTQTYAVTGWLVKTDPVPCAAPDPRLVEPNDDLSYYCGGSWITPIAERTHKDNQLKLIFDDGLHVQYDAYDNYAADPARDADGFVPRLGTYLVQPAGCPRALSGQCPVWRMVGRLDPPMP